MKKFTIGVVLFLSAIYFGQLIAQNETQSIQSHFDQLLESKQITPQDMQYEITDQHISSTSGVNHVYYRQTLNGLQIYGTQSDIHLLPTGEVLAKHNQFIRNAAEKMTGSSTPSINAVQAVQAAANQLNYNITEPLSVISSLNTPNQETLISDGGISITPIPAKLMYQLNEKELVVLVWDLSIQENSRQDWWNVRIDATTGQIVDQNNFMNSCSIEHDHDEMDVTAFVGPLNKNESASEVSVLSTVTTGTNALVGTYNVYAVPVESPNFGTRSLLVDPENLIASPFGWHDTDGTPGAESTRTTGNNVDAHKGGDRPDGGASLNFDFPIDLNENPATNTPPYLTNLFYLNNIMHDVFYQYGFDEASGNFQENNYGNGGAGSDSVDANGQVGNVCNANFGTPPDGQNPTMNMYICNGHDGNLDGGVVMHEYGHGVDRRLVAGPNNVGCNDNTENMGEGICDWLGMMVTIEPGDTGTDPRGVGTYLLGQAPNGPGVRNFRYSTDLTINPQTYASLPGTGGQTHNVGEIWGVTIWEVAWALIDEHGWDSDIYTFTGDVTQDAGNVQAMALIIEGLKLQPCNSGFVDARDAIFAADQAIYGGANECLLWDAFAKRGLGYSADQGSSSSHTDGTPAFDSPVPAINTEEEVCVGQGIQTYGGGTPSGGVYSGPGVTDDGNGLTYTFDPAVAGIGIHSIGYDVVSTCASGTAFDDIEVLADEPEVICQDITLELDANGEAVLTIYDIVTNLEPGALVVDQTGTFAPIDITATGTTVGLSDDDLSGSLNVGFDFSFYGTTYSNFFISSNGFITFDGSNDDGCCTGGVLPTPGDENNLIAMAWEDLNPASGGTIRYETVGTAPDRKLVVEFDNVPYWGTSDNVTSQIHLFETSNRIEIHSTSIPSNGPTTQGIENQNGTEGLATPGRNSQVWSAANDYVAYYYAPGGPADNCGSATTIELSQSLFTCDDYGTNVVTVTVTDGNGNVGTCTPTVTITDPLEVCLLSVEDAVLYRHIALFPNPTPGQLTLVNNTTSQLISAVISDVNGRTIKTVDLSNSGVNTEFSIEDFATGLYFVEISTATTSIVKRIVKQ